ncbi:hypothetical protein KL918_000873 [Ogataea parapolymorpha]|uniref:Splicing factor U2AF-associated protein 2 n=1 Tax=Ogataea parapolymorpha (strain ATCC 26012 / BCRC 20466 / JCM 22074 / NRRL Y-7560 / DL-1) TaxID=871575 RepID=W1Q8Y2_OGAPD|nr:Splicing factor U2AF-associated protein 2 [Ogataea parapolymorpha DL-1]ESW97266.1 Splicing factor U2AF-associated protein 2 [Ogataea parapolymorpha DL-1]KAG7869328.1 hypothetical protein KL918_000873 [Ogataea parapolymorpha]KAG7875620.1 hypothetical protein KL916_000291 [Ogataea parapolymorpha]
MPLIDDIQNTLPEDLPPDLSTYLFFDKVRARWVIENPEEKECFEFNPILERWVPVIQDYLPEKRPHDEVSTSEDLKREKRQRLDELKQEKEELRQFRRNRNTCIYVSQIPQDITYEELEAVFGKYGVLAQDLRTGSSKIKMYKDDEDHFKGDCLIEYLKEESCDLAIELLDETKLRPTDESPIRVSKAEFNNKAEQKPRVKMKTKERLQLKKKIERIHKKVNDWSDTEEDDETRRLREEKTLIFKHCFTLKELEDDPGAILDIKEDIREGCEEIGEVTNVVLYDLEEEGIVSVRFKSAVAANNCISKMNGRYFGGRRLQVEKYDGITQYKKSSGDAAEGDRLDRFAQWVEGPSIDRQ